MPRNSFMIALAVLFTALAGCGKEAPPKPAASAAQAAPAAPADKGAVRWDNWEKADTSKDGRLSRAEATAGHTPGIGDNFERIDANKDGFVTREERLAFRGASK